MAGKDSRPSKVMQIMEHLADNVDFLKMSHWQGEKLEVTSQH